MRAWLVCFLLAWPAAAEAWAAQPAETISSVEPLPDLAVPAKELADARKYFVFHKPGVTREQAEADLKFCWRNIDRGMALVAPTFVPWPRPAPAKPMPASTGTLGFAGDVVAGMLAGAIDRGIRQTRLMRCMIPRGYDRYRTSRAVWEVLNSRDPVRAISLQARIAAGPTPPTPQVEP